MRAPFVARVLVPLAEIIVVAATSVTTGVEAARGSTVAIVPTPAVGPEQ